MSICVLPWLTTPQGDTGAGKSSLLNALLGEEKVVPTNGMRACTAAIIELEAQPQGQEGYSGTVDFVSRYGGGCGDGGTAG